jgi:two-component system phosphate regulon sensor histidine kinase PhoR
MESMIALQSAPAAASVAPLPAMSVFTHELRSPVRVTSSLLNVLSQGYAGELNERQADLVERARRRLKALETLVDDILDLAAGKADGAADVARGPVSLSEVLHEVCVRYEPLAAEKGLSMQYSGLDDPLMVCGDQQELDRIVNNLVSNAVKYTQAGTVAVRTERIDGWVRISVADTGIGIPADAQQHLFQEFFRARNAKASGQTGTGLGLAIVKDLVERYDGRIHVESKEGIGTTVIVQLPALEDGNNDDGVEDIVLSPHTAWMLGHLECPAAG